MIVVITASTLCERWAREGFDFGHGLGDALHIRPLVLGPGTVSRITDPAIARADPQYAALSIVVHHDDQDIDAILKAVAAGLIDAPEPDKAGVANYIELSLGTSPAATHWRNLMQLRPDTYLGPMLRGVVDRAKAEAVAEAIPKAIAEAKAEFLLRYLDLRGIRISQVQRELVEACQDEKLLDEWFTRAVNATAAADVFVD